MTWQWNSRQYNIVIKWNIFFSASLIAVAVFVVWTRSTSVERLTNSLSWAEATARAHEQARTPCLCHLLLEKSRLFKHWLFSMVGWLTEAPHHRTRARMPPRRQTPRAPVVPVVSVLWYGSSCRARSPGKKLALQLFFWWMRKPTALDSKPCHVTGKQWLHAH